MPINNGWIKAGALVCALAVVLGGFLGDVDSLQSIESMSASPVQTNGAENAIGQQASAAKISKAAFFQLSHGLAIIAVGVLLVFRSGRLLHITAWSFMLGIVLYCGSNYSSVYFTNQTWLKHVELVGIVVLVCAWFIFVEAACPGWNRNSSAAEDSEN